MDKSTEWHNSTTNYRGVDCRVYSKHLLVIHTPTVIAGAWGSGGPEADEISMFKTVTVDASAAVLHEKK